jgi:hypothetical protein
MAYELQGTIIEIAPTQQISDKFKKREFVVEKKEDNNNGQVWTETIKFQTVQNKCELLDTLQVGDSVNVSFNIKGNKWEKNGQISYFNNLDAWRIEKGGASNFDGVDAAPPADTNFDSTPEEGGDLPF